MTGRVTEPRNSYRCGQTDNRLARVAKADALDSAEGSSRVRVMASARDTTGVVEGGMSLQG